MATNTPNYNLVKPAGSEVPDISVINSNMDKIDSQMKATSDLLANNMGRVNVWNQLTLLWDKGGSWGSMMAMFDRNTKVLHLGFQITGASGIEQMEAVPVLEIPFPVYGRLNQYSTSTGFSTGQLILSGTTGVLTLYAHSAGPTIVRCGMTVVLADDATP